MGSSRLPALQSLPALPHSGPPAGSRARLVLALARAVVCRARHQTVLPPLPLESPRLSALCAVMDSARAPISPACPRNAVSPTCLQDLGAPRAGSMAPLSGSHCQLLVATSELPRLRQLRAQGRCRLWGQTTSLCGASGWRGYRAAVSSPRPHLSSGLTQGLWSTSGCKSRYVGRAAFPWGHALRPHSEGRPVGRGTPRPAQPSPT